MTLSDFKIFDSLVREVACDVLERRGYDSRALKLDHEIRSVETAQFASVVIGSMVRRYSNRPYCTDIVQFLELVQDALLLASLGFRKKALLTAIESISPILGIGRNHAVTLGWLGNAMGERARLDAAA